MFSCITEEHRLISESARKLFESLVATDTERRHREGQRIDHAAVAAALSELGLFSHVADDASMQSAQVQALVSIEAGAAGLPFPVLENLVAHAVVARSVGAADVGAWVATLSSVTRRPEEYPVLQAERLRGVAPLVPFTGLAERAILAVRHGTNVALVEVALTDTGTARHVRASVEPDYPLDDLLFDGATVIRVIEGVDGCSVLGLLQQRSGLLAAAEIAGTCRRMITMTRDYLLARSQFGQVLGVNQALKHVMADAHVRVEALTAAVNYAAAAEDAAATDAEVAVCAAKHFAGRVGKAVAESMLQLHGAIGYTSEFPLHLSMRRAYRLAASYGSNRILGERLFELFRLSA